MKMGIDLLNLWVWEVQVGHVEGHIVGLMVGHMMGYIERMVVLGACWGHFYLWRVWGHQGAHLVWGSGGVGGAMFFWWWHGVGT